jgi:hypothetical protein
LNRAELRQTHPRRRVSFFVILENGVRGAKNH